MFGDLHTWDTSMFVVPLLDGGARTLATYRLPEDLRLLDLDDPKNLLERGLRPTQIVVRNLAVTQPWGHAAWSEPDPHDANARRWDANLVVVIPPPGLAGHRVVYDALLTVYSGDGRRRCWPPIPVTSRATTTGAPRPLDAACRTGIRRARPRRDGRRWAGD